MTKTTAKIYGPFAARVNAKNLAEKLKMKRLRVRDNLSGAWVYYVIPLNMDENFEVGV